MGKEPDSLFMILDSSLSNLHNRLAQYDLALRSLYFDGKGSPKNLLDKVKQAIDASKALQEMMVEFKSNMLSWRYNRFQPEIDRVESVGNVAKEVSEKKSGKYQEYAGEVLNLVACHITFVVTIRHRILLEIFGPQIQLPYPLKSFELKQRRARYWLLLTCLSPIASVLWLHPLLAIPAAAIGFMLFITVRYYISPTAFPGSELPSSEAQDILDGLAEVKNGINEFQNLTKSLDSIDFRWPESVIDTLQKVESDYDMTKDEISDQIKLVQNLYRSFKHCLDSISAENEIMWKNPDALWANQSLEPTA